MTLPFPIVPMPPQQYDVALSLEDRALLWRGEPIAVPIGENAKLVLAIGDSFAPPYKFTRGSPNILQIHAETWKNMSASLEQGVNVLSYHGGVAYVIRGV